jgi:pimeloyl-ACP methyl ester carboxylesterase
MGNALEKMDEILVGYEDLVLRKQEEPHITDSVMIVAPQFLDEIDHKHFKLGNDVLYWMGNSWTKAAGAGEEGEAISSYEVIDRIIEELVERNPKIEEVIVAGHSAGAQFVQRYGAANLLDGSIRAKMHYLVANPSTYLYLDGQRLSKSDDQFYTPTQEEVGSGIWYDNFRYGLRRLEKYPYLMQAGKAGIREQVKTRRFTYLLGELDNDATDPGMDATPAAQWQGPNRFIRGRNYERYLQHFYQDTLSNHQFKVIQGVGHTPSKMMQSAEALRVLFF